MHHKLAINPNLLTFSVYIVAKDIYMSMWATEQGGENGGMDEGEYVPFFFFFSIFSCISVGEIQEREEDLSLSKVRPHSL